jgi:hypothetical protein
MTHDAKQKILKRLGELAGESGTLTPGAVVDDASDPASPLHAHFQWDDSIAARAHRLDQARALIRIRVETVVGDEVFSVPVWVRSPDAEPRDQGYTSVLRLRDDAASSRAAIQNEIQRAISALTRARALAAVLGLSGEFAAMIRGVESLGSMAQDE